MSAESKQTQLAELGQFSDIVADTGGKLILLKDVP
jgi:hypothetical protein